MTISAVLLLSVFLGLFGVLLVIALVHLIQGLRLGGQSSAMVTTSTIFFAGIICISIGTWLLLRSVNWETPFEIHLPFVSASSEPQ